jgi:hypothetical protein
MRAAALARGYTNASVIWMLDEIQRIAKLPPRVRLEISAGLHTLFNACPSGLMMILSFSGQPSAELPDWFSPELADRIGETKVMVLPPLQVADARIFLKDVLRAHRPKATEGDDFAPFTHEAVDVVIARVAQAGDIRPRALMQAFGAVLEMGEPELKAGSIQAIGRDLASRALRERVSLTVGE